MYENKKSFYSIIRLKGKIMFYLQYINEHKKISYSQKTISKFTTYLDSLANLNLHVNSLHYKELRL